MRFCVGNVFTVPTCSSPILFSIFPITTMHNSCSTYILINHTLKEMVTLPNLKNVSCKLQNLKTVSCIPGRRLRTPYTVVNDRIRRNTGKSYTTIFSPYTVVNDGALTKYGINISGYIFFPLPARISLASPVKTK